MKSKVSLAIAGLVALVGVGLVASVFMFSSRPVKWLDDNAVKVDTDTYRADRPPIEFAQKMADAVKPTSRYVDASGIALRYKKMTVTITAGSKEGTSTIYVDRAGGTGRRYYYGVWAGSSFRQINGFSQAWDGSGDPSSMTSTRRASDFRGGGPGSGK